MNIEQAREVSRRLHVPPIPGLKPQESEVADTIDALIAELNDERMRCAQADNAVEQMAAELVRYKANATILQELHDQDAAEFNAITADRDEWRDEALSAQERFKAAEDKLASIKAQEPVGHLDGLDECADFMSIALRKGHEARNSSTPKMFTVPVYLAAGAQAHYEEQPDGSVIPVDPSEMQAGAQSIPAGYQLVPMEPTTAMVSAYLEANKAYWERTDELPKPPHKWRLGTPFDATINSYKAMLAAAPVQAGAQPAPKQEPVMQHCPNCNHEQMALSVDCGNCGNVYDAAPVQAQEHPISSGHPDDAGFELWWSEHMPETVQSVAISDWNAAQPTIRDFRTVQSAQERKPLTDEVVRLANVALHEMPRPSTDWHEAAKRVCQFVSAHGIKEQP